MAVYLKSIKFPVYPLSKSAEAHYEDKKLIAKRGSKEYIIDDLSIDKHSLGLRRLLIPKDELYPLKKSILDIGNFFLYTKIYKTFIDSNGVLVKYVAKHSVPLVYRKIKVKVPYKNGIMLIVEGIHCPIWYHRKVEGTYAALLCIDRGYVLLGITNNPSRKTKFKI